MRRPRSSRPIRTVLLAAALSLPPLFIPQAWGQPGFTVSLGRAFGSIAETGVLSDTRQTTVGGVEAEQMLAAERLRVYYELDAGNYATPGDWHYFLHNAGATWTTACTTTRLRRMRAWCRRR